MQHYSKVQNPSRFYGSTWAELTEREPRLNELLWQARSAGAQCRSWEEVPRLFAPFRGALAELVGVMSSRSGDPVLESVSAYDVAYRRLYEAVSGLLPPANSIPSFASSQFATWHHEVEQKEESMQVELQLVSA